MIPSSTNHNGLTMDGIKMRKNSPSENSMNSSGVLSTATTRSTTSCCNDDKPGLHLPTLQQQQLSHQKSNKQHKIDKNKKEIIIVLQKIFIFLGIPSTTIIQMFMYNIITFTTVSFCIVWYIELLFNTIITCNDN